MRFNWSKIGLVAWNYFLHEKTRSIIQWPCPIYMISLIYFIIKINPILNEAQISIELQLICSVNLVPMLDIKHLISCYAISIENVWSIYEMWDGNRSDVDKTFRSWNNFISNFGTNKPNNDDAISWSLERNGIIHAHVTKLSFIQKESY